ncbi:MAG: tetratricopeptide repeat protein, partial [Deltaproteobacteria bacterium]|nr:tetratricopeptide repeat protein [Deltaproteobacteria bacterium]
MIKHRNIQQKLSLIISLLLIAAILIAYWQVKNFDFIDYDDESYVTKNPHVRAGLTREGIIRAFTTDHEANWHPLTWLSHMLDCELYGLNPMGHHWTSLQIHIANTLLLFLILQYMTGALWRSAFVAALFALHPLHVESVAWVAERKDVLSAFFGMLTILAYCRYAKQPSIAGYILIILFLGMGLMAKPMLVTLPFLLLLLDFWPLGRLRFATISRLVPEKIPLFVLSAVSTFVTYFVQQHGGAVTSLEVLPLKIRIANALISYLSYIEKMIWPSGLAVFYPYPERLLGQAVLSGLVIFCLSVLVIQNSHRFPYLVTGWLWYLGTLVPVIGLVQVGSQSMADRYTYIPLIGLFIIVAWGIADILMRYQIKRVALAIVYSSVLAFFMISAWFQVRHWQNSVTLFTHTLNVTHNNSHAHYSLGYALARQGKLDKAIVHYSRALQINPNYTIALNSLGYALAHQGKIDKAIVHYSRALQINPDYVNAHNNLGNALAHQENIKGAFFHYYEALRINPDYDGAYFNLGKIYANQGKIGKAIINYKKAIRINPDMTQALYNLSWINATCENENFRNSIEAVGLAEKLCDLTSHSQPLALDALAAAYAEAGRFNEAVATAQEALKLVSDNGPKELAPNLKKRLRLFQAG